MTAYYPSQVGGYAATQPMYGPSAGYAATPYPVTGSAYAQPMAASYAQPVAAAGVMPSVAAPVMMQPSYGHHHYGYHNPYSFGARLRRFFGLAPKTGVVYKHDHSTWGFMGWSRRPRYTDVRTGGEVDRLGRPVYRV